MIYIKGQVNTLIVNASRAFVYPYTQRQWLLEFYHMSTNEIINHSIPDTSPYPDSFMRFDIDDNIYDLKEGLYKLTVYEVKFKSPRYLYSEQIIRVIVPKTVTEYDGEKNYVVYG